MVAFVATFRLRYEVHTMVTGAGPKSAEHIFL